MRGLVIRMRKGIILGLMVSFCFLNVGFAASNILAVEAGHTWKFIVFGDTPDKNINSTTGITPNLSMLATAIATEKPAFVVHIGDLISGIALMSASPVYQNYPVQFQNFQAAMQPIYAAKIPFYAMRGNREYGKSAEDTQITKAYADAIARSMPQNGPPTERGLTYSFEHNNSKMIVLDEFTGSENSNITLNLNWLKTELNNNRKPVVFVFGHSPAFDVNQAGGIHDYDKNPGYFLYANKELSGDFWKLLKDNNVRAYIVGHLHFYSRGENNGIWQVVQGNDGPPIDYDPQKVTRELVNVFPQQQISKANIVPGYLSCLVNEGSNDVVCSEWVVDQTGNKKLMDTITMSPRKP